ncbi:OmpP1/FadL family transporter [Atopomonas hussainii]|uniref:OmpP1/FadL family transporter n=1 Tax=Atopomonas hussainii TaxID=1429083 RepID=UPI0009002EE8|nr:TonB-dependent receptor [Atopomonas hussainii]
MRRLPCLTVAVLAAGSSSVMAGGFALNEQSASAAGTAYAGRASSALDASTVFGNPAGMSLLDEQVTGGIAGVWAKSDIDAEAGNGTNEGDMVPLKGIPFGYYVTPINDTWHFGLGVYAPFGMATNYESTFQGRAYGDKSDVKVTTVQPTLSVQLNDQLSLGFGVTLNKIEGILSSDPIPGLQRVRIEGDDKGYGYNLGMLYQLNEATRLGLTYRSKVDYTLRGHGDFIGLVNQRIDGKLELTTPESVEASVSHALDNRWTVHAGATWTRWSRLETIEVKFDNGMTTAEPQEWRDVVSGAVGASYQLTPQWLLRAGLAYDPTPTNNEHRSPRIPSGDRWIGTVGFGYQVSEQLTIDGAYGYVKEDKVKVNRHSSVPGVQDYRAEYDNHAHVLTVGATYRF